MQGEGFETFRTESIVAYRSWDTNRGYLYTQGDSRCLLFSGSGNRHNPHSWPHNKPKEAYCGHNKCAPALDCSCGIYCCKSYQTLINNVGTYRYVRGEHRIFGLVSIWGTVIEHDDGYRAQFAYPKHFIAFTPEDRERIAPYAKAYNVPMVEFTPTQEDRAQHALDRFKQLSPQQQRAVIRTLKQKGAL